MSAGLGVAAQRRAARFMRANLPLSEVPGTGVRLHLAGPRSGLSRLVPAGGTPYWAHAWPGGAALAMHLAAHPGTVRGRFAIDLGAGSGLVAIAAMLAGAGAAIAIDPDPLAAVAVGVNALANGVPPHAIASAPALDPGQAARWRGPVAVLAGDVFYDEATAALAAAALDRARAACPTGTPILVGDVGRRFLPRDRLEPLASYKVRDVGDPPGPPRREGWVHRWCPNGKGAR